MSSPLSPPSQARSIATRARLLTAAVDALVADGYAGASTTRIAKRAAVSQGALFKHFPSKHALLAEALRQLFTELVEDFRGRLARDQRGDRLGAAIGILWDIFCSPTLQAAFELYLAARTDAELASLVAPVLSAHQQNLLAEARALFPEAAGDNPDFNAMIGSIMNMMQGAAMAASVLPSGADGARELALIERIARQELVRGVTVATAAQRPTHRANLPKGNA
jgi:AcrR family transcriptional regulator